jgi:Caspase domain
MRPSIKQLCLTAFLVAALFVPASARAQGREATLHQVVAGVSQYAPGFQKNLGCAHKDAIDVAAFWHKHGPKMFGKVSGEALLDQRATRQNILARLDEVIAQARAGDWTVIFLAGHGGPVGQGWGFCAHDAVVTGQELQQKIAQLANKGVTVLLILDSCHSGMMAVPETNAVVMAACGGNETSSEFGNGNFTRALLEALRGWADANHDGQITLAEVRSYVTDQVGGFSHRQNPVFSLPAGMNDSMALVGVVSLPASPRPHNGR